ncbi:hypothetical protein ACFE04_001602 [Oxalis oulophora]
MNTKTITSDVETSTDRFIELPDDIISKIISSLTLKQAVTTSAISTRWRDLWKLLYSGFIDFDGSTTIQDLKRRYDQYRCELRLECLAEKERCKFINWVNQVLPSHKCATIKRFRLSFDLRKVPQHIINDWIQFASSKNVQCLELDFSTYNISRLGRSDSWYDFPSGSHCRFQSLTTVSLKNVGISPETFEHLLGCPNLEELNVADCSNLRKELCYNYKTPLRGQSFNLYSLSLKKLTLWVCGNNLDHWNIVAPNLLSFTYCPCQSVDPNLVLEYVPRLNYLNIKHSHWCRYETNLLQLQELVCDMCSCYYCDCNIKWPIKLPNLKNITIKHAIGDSREFNHFVAHLKAAPLLENLIVELPWNKIFTESWEKAKDIRYNNLKTVKLIGYGATTDVDIIRYFLSRAPLLEKIIIDPCEPSCLGTSEEILYRESSRYLEDRNRIINLTSNLPLNIADLQHVDKDTDLLEAMVELYDPLRRGFVFLDVTLFLTNEEYAH